MDAIRQVQARKVDKVGRKLRCRGGGVGQTSSHARIYVTSRDQLVLPFIFQPDAHHPLLHADREFHRLVHVVERIPDRRAKAQMEPYWRIVTMPAGNQAKIVLNNQFHDAMMHIVLEMR